MITSPTTPIIYFAIKSKEPKRINDRNSFNKVEDFFATNCLKEAIA